MTNPSNNDFPGLNSCFEDNFHKSGEEPDLKAAIFSMENHFSTWCGEFIHAIEHDLRRKYDLDQNIFIAYLATQTMVWDWMAFSMRCGCYNLVARELRSILESIALFIHIENSKSGNNLDCKIDYWHQLEDKQMAHGKKIFKASGLPKWEEVYELYRNLCAFTHSGLETYQSDIKQMAVEGQVLEFKFSKEKFLSIYDLWLKVADVSCDAALLMYKNLNETPNSFDPKIFSLEKPQMPCATTPATSVA
jgi:hypothetical protein